MIRPRWTSVKPCSASCLVPVVVDPPADCVSATCKASIVSVMHVQVQASVRVLALLKLSAAQNLTAESVLQLLETSLRSKLPTSVHALCGLPAATQLPAAHVTNLLQLAMQLEGAGVVRVLCSLPAAQNLGVDVVYDLVAAGVKDSNKVSALCRLPAAAQLQAGQIAALLQQALESDSPAAFAVLHGLPAAQGMQPGVLN